MMDHSKSLHRYWPFWGMNFTLHVMIGLIASMAGMVVLFTTGEYLSGLALIGAGSFAIINGWQGLRELGSSKEHRIYMNAKEDDR